MGLGLLVSGGVILYSSYKTAGNMLSPDRTKSGKAKLITKPALSIVIPAPTSSVTWVRETPSPTTSSTGSPIPETPLTESPLLNRITTPQTSLIEHGKKLLPLLTDILPNETIEKEAQSVSEKRTTAEKIKKEEGSRKDSQADEIIALEKGISAAIKKSPEELAEFLNVQGFNRVLEQDGMTVWESPRGQFRFLTDNNTFKFKLFLDKLKKLDQTKTITFKDLNPDSNKLCTSVATNRHPTFCGADGVIVYLGPKSRPYSGQSCDVLSITEDWNIKNKTFQTSRTHAQGYCLDQVIYSMSYDWVEKVRQGYIKELETLLATQGLGKASREKLEGALELLKQKPTSILKKDFLTTEEPKTELELQIEQLIHIGNEFPIFTKTKMHSFLQTTHKTVSIYSKHKDVIARSFVQKQVSGWEVSVKELSTTHPLVGLRSQLASIQKDYAALCGSTDLDPEIAKLLPEQVSSFLSSHLESFNRNVGKSATSYLTVTEVIEDNAKQKKEMIEKLKQIQELVKNNGNPKAKEINKNCEEAIEQISKMYNEVQFYTTDQDNNPEELSITGFGVKAALAKQAMATNYAERLTMYNTHKKDLDTAKTKLEGLNTTVKDQLDEEEFQYLH